MLGDVISEILNRNGLNAPDGRPLHAYQVTSDEAERLRALLPQRVRINDEDRMTGIGFVLWASERVRRDYAAGHLTWEFIFDGLHPQLQLDNRQQTGVHLVSNGFSYWQRPIRRYENGRQYLYSLLAEAGLPDAALADGAAAYRAALLQVISAVERGGMLGGEAAISAAHLAVNALPGVLRNADMAHLLADIGLGLVGLRSRLPDNLLPGTQVGWLDANLADWRQTLPLRFSERTINGIISPALETPRVASQEAPITRQLRRVGQEWVGFAVIHDGAVVPFGLLPDVDPANRLRFITEDQTGFFGSPSEAGWTLSRTGGSGDVTFLTAPDDPVILSAYRDGHPVGSAVLCPALPTAEEAGSFWRGGADPVVLTQITGRVQTRDPVVFLLWSGPPPSVDDGLELGDPEPAPGGHLWPIRGDGVLILEGASFRVRTGADADAPEIRLALLGRTLSGQLTRPDLQVHLGEPQVLVSEAGGPFRPVSPVWRDGRRLLGGRVAEWVRDGEVLTRASLVTLPPDFNLTMTETGVGSLLVQGRGMKTGWHLHVTVNGITSSGAADQTGAVSVHLQAPPPCGAVSARVVDPVVGREITLGGVWPSRLPSILRPDGSVLCENVNLSHGQLLGWRGSAPQNGSLDVRVHAQGGAVSFRVPDVSSLVTHLDMIKPIISLNGLDGRVNLTFVSAGVETPRLSVGKYGWSSEEMMKHLNVRGRDVRLTAVNMSDPSMTREIRGKNLIDLLVWLGDQVGPWLVQGEATEDGYMRPFLWSLYPIPQTTREERIAGYEARWRALLEDPSGAGWSEMWEPISAVRSVGDGASLDQVQALGRVPAAAVSALFRSGRKKVSEILGLEGEAPIWWPSARVADWAEGLRVARAAVTHQVSQIIQDNDETEGHVRSAIEQAAEAIILLRPELKAHVGFAMLVNDMTPVIPVAGRITPLHSPNPLRALADQAQLAVQRHDHVPGGVGDVVAAPSPLTEPLQEFAGPVQPLLHAPLVTAEAAMGTRDPLTPHQLLQLTALRLSDPAWFDAALPLALTHLYGAQQ